MFDNALLVYINDALLLVLIASTPVLLVAVIIGVSIGLIQALTQIQDQTLPQAVKLIVTLVVVIMLGPFFAQSVADHTSRILDDFPSLTR